METRGHRDGVTESSGAGEQGQRDGISLSKGLGSCRRQGIIGMGSLPEIWVVWRTGTKRWAWVSILTPFPTTDFGFDAPITHSPYTPTPGTSPINSHSQEMRKSRLLISAIPSSHPITHDELLSQSLSHPDPVPPSGTSRTLKSWWHTRFGEGIQTQLPFFQAKSRLE